MTTSTSIQDHIESQAADVLIPLIRAAATIVFAVAPCSLGFVIIAVSEQLIRSIMVGDDPEMLVSDLQNQFPNSVIEAADKDPKLVAQIVDMIDRRTHDGSVTLPRRMPAFVLNPPSLYAFGDAPTRAPRTA